MSSKIEWTQETWNPIVGCSKISEGCQNCYAERMAFRLACMAIQKDGYSDLMPYTTVVDEGWRMAKWNGKTAFRESELEKPLHWKKPRRIFVCSMGDLFHESVPLEWQARVLSVIAECQQHTFMILTKRPQVMADLFNNRHQVLDYCPNLWLGVTVENQQAADERIPTLLQIPAAVRFVSVEPMLGPINLDGIWGYSGSATCDQIDNWPIHWVICGGESGPGARPMNPEWVRLLRDQCQAAEVPFFFKQWGEWAGMDACAGLDAPKRPWHDFDEDVSVWRIGKKKAGRVLDGEIWDQYPIKDKERG